MTALHINTPHLGSFLFSPFPKNTDFLSQESSIADPCIFCSESMKKWQLHPRNNPEGFDDPHPKPAFNRDSHKGVTAGTISDSAKGLQGAIGAKGAKQPFPVHTGSLFSLSAMLSTGFLLQPRHAEASLEQALGLHSLL